MNGLGMVALAKRQPFLLWVVLYTKRVEVDDLTRHARATELLKDQIGFNLNVVAEA